MNQNLHYPYLLAAHMICADGQLHQNELLLFHQLGKSADINEATLAEAQRILNQADIHMGLEDVLRDMGHGQRNQALRMSALAAHYDGVLDRAEVNLLMQLQKRWEISNATLEKIRLTAQQEAQELTKALLVQRHPEMSKGAQFLNKLDNVLGLGTVDRVVDTLGTASMKERFREFRIEALLSGPHYDAAIQSCKGVGLRDIAVTDAGIVNTAKALKQILATFYNKVTDIQKSLGTKPAPEVRQALKTLKDDQEIIKRYLGLELEELQALQIKKRRAMNYYTIAFMGRSKAGKSTLHAVVTGGGWDQIGAGKQNTTRLNRVYEWHNIRIIDTPGIATPGGAELEKVAESVIDEADLICFVVTNNNQHSSEFEFLKRLREKGKPLLVLLNVKDDLSHPKRLERFLKNPDQHFSEDKQHLGGHIDRIRRDAAQHYGTANFPIVPVQLLAAQIAQQQPDHPQADALMKASRLQDFLDSVRLSLLEQGLLRRSQNLLGSTVADIQKPIGTLQGQAQFYLDFAAKLKERAGESEKRLIKAQTDRARALESTVRSLFADLNALVPDFAESHWDSSQETLNNAWAARIDNFNIPEKIGAAQQHATTEFSDEVADLLNEVGEEIALIRSAEAGAKTDHLSGQDSSVWGQKIAKWGGSLLQAVGAFVGMTPVGWVLMGIGTVINFLSSFFESKAEKRRKAVAKISEALESQIEAQLKKVENEVVGSFKNQCANGTQVVMSYFKSSIENFQFVGHALQASQNLIEQEKMMMNKVFAARILDFAGGEPSDDGFAQMLQKIVRVNRTVGQSIVIQLKEGSKFKAAIDGVQEIVQERVIVEILGVKK